jgi:hypothetical protein
MQSKLNGTAFVEVESIPSFVVGRKIENAKDRWTLYTVDWTFCQSIRVSVSKTIQKNQKVVRYFFGQQAVLFKAIIKKTEAGFPL